MKRTYSHVIPMLIIIMTIAQVSFAQSSVEVKDGSVKVKNGGSEVKVNGNGVATTTTQTSGKSVVINGNGTTKTITAGNLTINGNHHIITVNGYCAQLLIQGNNNSINLTGGAGSISIPGNHNVVKYKASPQAATSVTDLGTGNSISKTE